MHGCRKTGLFCIKNGAWGGILAFVLRMSVVVFSLGTGLCFAQGSPASSSAAADQGAVTEPKTSHQAADQSEVETLKAQVKQLQEQMALLLQKQQTTSAASGVQATAPEQNGQDTEQKLAKQTISGQPQYTGAPNDPRLAMATKANGGDLSGLGNLLRSDRLTLGGYGDFQFRQSSLNEKNDGGGTPTFQNTRFILGLAAVLAKKQNIVFNSEIEYELGTSEIDVEQAFVDWKVRPEFGFRGGIFVPAIGRFNTYHDSNLNIATLRPLINQYILPTAYRDAGIGVRGRISLPGDVKLTYEADVVNGMQRLANDGTPTPFSRMVGQSSAAEPTLIAFQNNNDHMGFAGRLGISPILGLEFGVSGYNRQFNNLGDPPQSVTLLFVDGSYHRGPLEINGEYGHSNIVGGGIVRKSPAPPIVDPSDPASVTALAQFVAQPSPGQDGFYVEGAYRFKPRSFAERFDESSYIAPVVRFEAVRLDRTIPDFYLNRSRVTLGTNIAPSQSVIFKLDYTLNHTFGPVPNVPGPIGSANFGINPIPFRDYGRNGFTGSIAYVF